MMIIYSIRDHAIESDNPSQLIYSSFLLKKNDFRSFIEKIENAGPSPDALTEKISGPNHLY